MKGLLFLILCENKDWDIINATIIIVNSILEFKAWWGLAKSLLKRSNGCF